MKYIIELREEANMVQAINVTQNGTVYIDAKYVTELKELNSDYINEHFGSLQDDAYQRGFEDGKAVNDKGCEGCEYEGNNKMTQPCILCCNSYKNRWTAKDDKFEFGDEIIDKCGIKGCVVSRDNEEKNTMYALFNGHDVPQCITQKNYRKTGRHFDIASILEDMRND